MDMVMCHLLNNPYNSLDPKFNTALLQIFESFRHLMDQNKTLMANLQQSTEREAALEYAMSAAADGFNCERQAYKAEVKRLELILAKGKRGLAEVTIARQDSILRQRRMSDDRTMETIFEFLEKTKRYEDRVWSSQRGKLA